MEWALEESEGMGELWLPGWKMVSKEGLSPVR